MLGWVFCLTCFTWAMHAVRECLSCALSDDQYPLGAQEGARRVQALPSLREETQLFVSSLVVAMPPTATHTISLCTSDAQSVVRLRYEVGKFHGLPCLATSDSLAGVCVLMTLSWHFVDGRNPPSATHQSGQGDFSLANSKRPHLIGPPKQTSMIKCILPFVANSGPQEFCRTYSHPSHLHTEETLPFLMGCWRWFRFGFWVAFWGCGFGFWLWSCVLFHHYVVFPILLR